MLQATFVKSSDVPLPVSADFSADEKMEMESIKMYKKDLLDDIQVNTCRPRKLHKTPEMVI